MRAPPRLRGGLGRRLSVLFVGLFLFAAGIVALLESSLGLSPWDVLHQGLARQTPLAFPDMTTEGGSRMSQLSTRPVAETEEQHDSGGANA